MQYNTSQKRMALPEYGRSVQNMVDHALTIDDRDERQLCANTIIEIMGNMFPHLRDVPDFKHKLWDHLAMMSDFKLDIDYPYEIVKKELLYEKPKPVAYQQSFIRYRHYGKTVERLIDEAIKYPEGDEKNNLNPSAPLTVAAACTLINNLINYMRDDMLTDYVQKTLILN